MEEKNNATEKVENITKDSVNQTSQQNADKTPAQKMKEEITGWKADGESENWDKNENWNKNEKSRKKSMTREQWLEQKAAREKEKEARRYEKAKLADERKAAQKAKKQEKRKAAEKRKNDLKLEKLKRKEERLKRRDMLKNETKTERMERIAREKQARRDERQARREALAQKREEQAKLKSQKIEAKRALKEQKRKLRFADKKDRRSRGFGGWLAAVISLGVMVLVLGTLLTFSMMGTFEGNDMLENTVERSFYDLVSYVDNIDVNMSKLMVSNDSGEQQRLLSDITVQASLASSDINELPLRDESKYYTTKYINQVADFSKYLNNKIIDGGKMSETDWQNLSELYKINMTLKSELTTLSSKIGENYEFVSLLNEDKDNVVLESFVTLEKGAVDYPQLIYDGPFSDSLDTSEVKGLSGEEISSDDAIDIFKSTFSQYDFDKAEIVGEVNGKIDCFAVEATDGDVRVYAEISKTGGKLVMFDCYADCTKSEFDLTSCIQKADEFLTALGFSDMKAVWTAESAATVYLNYAYVDNGVIVYPDMVKLTVCQERGVVSSFDATEYYLNHTKRAIGKAKITQEQAIKNLSTNLEVETIRLAVIPKGNDREILSYEISGTFGGATYYVYVDAKSGNEAQIFRVVETTEGMLLM